MSLFLGRIRTHQDGVRDADDLVDGKVGAAGVLANRLRARRLVDAHRADRAAALLEHVAADPADVGRHLLVSHLAGWPRSRPELGRAPPAGPSQSLVHLHRASWHGRADRAETSNLL